MVASSAVQSRKFGNFSRPDTTQLILSVFYGTKVTVKYERYDISNTVVEGNRLDPLLDINGAAVKRYE